ncbi:MAG TPA: TIGR00282 family metallophosphoesterase [Thermoanaerobaculia bacterium]|nr:TIGR00282 family metallophosphoesterase [Thermoanaerobaculia bacterium]
MRLLFVGDVIGKPGRQAVARLLPELVDRRRIDYTVVNIENAAGGFGITPEVLEELSDLPVDCFTSGNHIWDKKAGLPLLDERANLLRPANYPSANPGRGVHVGETPAGIPVATLNLEGQVFMSPLDSPFDAADVLLQELDGRVKVILVDFHAEATSEKQAMGFHLDGRVSAVVGTHTHVPTADARILAGGTAFITDVGMTGPYDSIIGFRSDKVLRRFRLRTPSPFEVAKDDVRLAAALLEIDPKNGKAQSIEPLLLPVA